MNHLTSAAFRSFFITGCYRSGTTLIDKYLSNHHGCHAFSQPMTSLFLKSKEVFYRKIGNPSPRYLGLGSPPKYRSEEFRHFLEFNERELADKDLILRELSELSRQLGIELTLSYPSNLDFASIYINLLKLLQVKNGIDASTVGVKEILCQEYIPYFIENDIKVVVIIRDPRNMVESLNFGKGEEFTGGIRPTLLNLHNWREVCEFAIGNNGHPNLFFFRYEDFIQDTTVRKDLCLFLDLSPCEVDINALKDGSGKVWKPNSSFLEKPRKRLDETTASYVESVCFWEMQELAYETSIDPENIPAIISNFKEPWPVQHRDYYDLDYSTKMEMIEYEVERYRQRRSLGE